MIAVLVLVLVIFIYRQSSGYNIVEYELQTAKNIGTAVKFVMLSDMHDTDVTHDHNEGLLKAIDEVSPDFVILAGDMITCYRSSRHPDNAFDLMRKLSSRYTVYCGLGNHEQRYRLDKDKYPGKYEEFERFVRECGIRLLSDDHIDLPEKNLTVYGYDLPMDYYKRFAVEKIPDGQMRDVLGSIDERRYNILIAHSPDHFDEYADWGPDLVLSGHLHGGIIVLPGIGGVISPQLELFPKYDFGIYSKHDTTMIVSRGIGWHSIPLRIFNKAEIVSVTVTGKTED